MRKILSLLNDVTGGVCYDTYRYCADEELRVPSVGYDDMHRFSVKNDHYGETDNSLRTTKDIGDLAKKVAGSKPLFQYFMDGSRRVYKVDDIELNRRVFPIMAGQIGCACCTRTAEGNFKSQSFIQSFVLALPSEANPEVKHSDLFFNNLTSRINELEKIEKSGVAFSKILQYSSKQVSDPGGHGSPSSNGIVEIPNRFEFLGTAAIQDEMIDCEKKLVANLTAKNLLNEDRYIIKDGSLQYKPMRTGEYKELSKIKNNYRWAVGVSKQFNPEFSKDRAGRSQAAQLAKLPLFSRTPAYMFQHDRDQWSYLGDHKFSIWYLRIRDSKYTEGPFGGIVKIEKILVTENEMENGLESELVDLISANIINERNPVCYGADKRWANHLYPIYLTEQFIKSKYLSDIHFLNLF